MEFTVQREDLLKPLQSVLGVVEKRHVLPILANVKLHVENNVLTLTATDLEVELIARVPLAQPGVAGTLTVPARKLSDICRSLPEGAAIRFSLEAKRPVITSGKSRFLLSSMPAEGFPSIESQFDHDGIQLDQKEFAGLLKKTQFAMAQQDVRYFLNGMLFEVSAEMFRVVATDGHRLAMSTLERHFNFASVRQVIVPRKAILELLRLLGDSSDSVNIRFGTNHIRFEMKDYTFTSKLLEGRYPDYNRVIPAQGKNLMQANRDLFRNALARAAILSNEQYRGVRLQFKSGSLHLMANNPEHEEAQDEIDVHYQGRDLEIGFNVSYLLDVLGVNGGEEIRMSLEDAHSSALIRAAHDDGCLYVVMPMKI